MDKQGMYRAQGSGLWALRCEVDLGLLEEGQQLKLPVQVTWPRETGAG